MDCNAFGARRMPLGACYVHTRPEGPGGDGASTVGADDEMVKGGGYPCHLRAIIGHCYNINRWHARMSE